MSAFTKVGKASASAAASAIKSVGKELSTNALLQTLSGKKGRINYKTLSRTPSPSISPPVSRATTPYLKPVNPVYSRSNSMRSNSIGSLNNLNINEYNNTQDTVFKPIKTNKNYLYGGKLKATRKYSKKSLSQRRRVVKKHIKK